MYRILVILSRRGCRVISLTCVRPLDVVTSRTREGASWPSMTVVAWLSAMLGKCKLRANVKFTISRIDAGECREAFAKSEKVIPYIGNTR